MVKKLAVLVAALGFLFSCGNDPYDFPPYKPVRAVNQIVIPEEIHKRPYIDIGFTLHGDEYHQVTFDLMKNKLNSNIIRTPARWVDAEPVLYEPRQFNFTEHRRIANMAIANDFDLMFLVNDTPAWALPESMGNISHDPPDDPRMIYEYAYKLAEEFKGQIKSYQFYAEQNGHAPTTEENPHGWGHEPWRYYLIIMYGAHAVKSADPDAKVIFGGVGNAEDRYLREIYELNNLVLDLIKDSSINLTQEQQTLLGNIPEHLDDLRLLFGEDPDMRKWYDKMALHNYLAWNDPDVCNSECGGDRWHQGGGVILSSMEDITCISRLMDEYNDDKQIWITETGFSSWEPGYVNHENIILLGRHISEELAGIRTARYLERLQTENQFHRIERIFWYELQDFTEEPQYFGYREYGFGVLDNFYMDYDDIEEIPEDKFKPAFYSIKNFIERYSDDE